MFSKEGREGAGKKTSQRNQNAGETRQTRNDATTETLTTRGNIDVKSHIRADKPTHNTDDFRDTRQSPARELHRHTGNSDIARQYWRNSQVRRRRQESLETATAPELQPCLANRPTSATRRKDDTTEMRDVLSTEENNVNAKCQELSHTRRRQLLLCHLSASLKMCPKVAPFPSLTTRGNSLRAHQLGCLMLRFNTSQKIKWLDLKPATLCKPSCGQGVTQKGPGGTALTACAPAYRCQEPAPTSASPVVKTHFTSLPSMGRLSLVCEVLRAVWCGRILRTVCSITQGLIQRFSFAIWTVDWVELSWIGWLKKRKTERSKPMRQRGTKTERDKDSDRETTTEKGNSDFEWQH